MNTKEFSMWTMNNGLFLLAKKHYLCFKKVFQECLKAEKNDVLILTDTGHEGKRLAPLTAECYRIAAKELGLNVKVVTQKPKLKGDSAEDEVVKQLDKLQNGSIIVSVVSFKIGSLEGLDKSFRNLMKEREHRFVSTSNIGGLKTDQYNNLFEPVDIDYIELQERCSRIKEILDNGKEIHVTTKAGTDLYYNIKGKKAIENSGKYYFDEKRHLWKGCCRWYNNNIKRL
jgi:leucyl aminopeptidase (aminopeptidase T)